MSQNTVVNIRTREDDYTITADGTWQNAQFQHDNKIPYIYVVTAGGNSFQLKSENSRTPDTALSPEPMTRYDSDLLIDDSENPTLIKAASGVKINITRYRMTFRDVVRG